MKRHKTLFNCGKMWLILGVLGDGAALKIYLKCGNDQCILSHWQLFWHLGIYLLRQIFMGFRRRSVVASWVYLTYCMDRNSCKAVLGCEWERAFVCFDMSHSLESASSSLCECHCISLYGYIDLFALCNCSIPLEPAGLLNDSWTPIWQR